MVDNWPMISRPDWNNPSSLEASRQHIYNTRTESTDYITRNVISQPASNGFHGNLSQKSAEKVDTSHALSSYTDQRPIKKYTKIAVICSIIQQTLTRFDQSEHWQEKSTGERYADVHMWLSGADNELGNCACITRTMFTHAHTYRQRDKVASFQATYFKMQLACSDTPHCHDKIWFWWSPWNKHFQLTGCLNAPHFDNPA
jgi:hypothetical protein